MVEKTPGKKGEPVSTKQGEGVSEPLGNNSVLMNSSNLPKTKLSMVEQVKHTSAASLLNKFFNNLEITDI